MKRRTFVKAIGALAITPIALVAEEPIIYKMNKATEVHSINKDRKELSGGMTIDWDGWAAQ